MHRPGPRLALPARQCLHTAYTWGLGHLAAAGHLRHGNWDSRASWSRYQGDGEPHVPGVPYHQVSEPLGLSCAGQEAHHSGRQRVCCEYHPAPPSPSVLYRTVLVRGRGTDSCFEKA